MQRRGFRGTTGLVLAGGPNSLTSWTCIIKTLATSKQNKTGNRDVCRSHVYAMMRSAATTSSTDQQQELREVLHLGGGGIEIRTSSARTETDTSS